MQGLANNYLYQGSFGNATNNARKQRYCRLSIQTWVYIHSAISTLTSLLGVFVGIMFLAKTELYEQLFLYRLALAYLGRAYHSGYCAIYRVFFCVWIAIHALHLVSICSTIVAVQKSDLKLLKPQLVVLVIQIGNKIPWLTLIALLLYSSVAISNLNLIALLHKFLDEKMSIINDILSYQAKTVHFKDVSAIE
ncbi:unnamed protein product [Caenorhabditis sp. 36 PRJEB53466]|nr:unnamed protein product [Caenorhabditis sp. 36 PRJEB53466]